MYCYIPVVPQLRRSYRGMALVGPFIGRDQLVASNGASLSHMAAGGCDFFATLDKRCQLSWLTTWVVASVQHNLEPDASMTPQIGATHCEIEAGRGGLVFLAWRFSMPCLVGWRS